jgi:hypothetical protein
LLEGKKRTVLLGIAFLILLIISSVENTVFFGVLTPELFLNNQFLAIIVLFMHNIIVISLILLGMTFYVSLVVSEFFKREKYAHIVLEHPRLFAAVFTIMIIFLSLLRGSSLIYGGVTLEVLPLILLVSVPIGVVEGYAIYVTINKTLSQTLSLKILTSIYGIFFLAAIMEVAFINLLIFVSIQ